MFVIKLFSDCVVHGFIAKSIKILSKFFVHIHLCKSDMIAGNTNKTVQNSSIHFRLFTVLE